MNATTASLKERQAVGFGVDANVPEPQKKKLQPQQHQFQQQHLQYREHHGHNKSNDTYSKNRDQQNGRRLIGHGSLNTLSWHHYHHHKKKKEKEPKIRLYFPWETPPRPFQALPPSFWLGTQNASSSTVNLPLPPSGDWVGHIIKLVKKQSPPPGSYRPNNSNSDDDMTRSTTTTSKTPTNSDSEVLSDGDDTIPNDTDNHNNHNGSSKSSSSSSLSFHQYINWATNSNPDGVPIVHPAINQVRLFM